MDGQFPNQRVSFWTIFITITYLGGPKNVKNTPTLGGFRPKLPQFTTTKPPELCNIVSLGPVHKMPGRLDHSKGPKSLIYYTPITCLSLSQWIQSELTTFKKRYQITAQAAQIQAQKSSINVENLILTPVLVIKIHEIALNLIKSKKFRCKNTCSGGCQLFAMLCATQQYYFIP